MRKMRFQIVRANQHYHHKILVKMSKKSSYINAFSSMMFSSLDAYNKGWIREAYDPNRNDIVGFTCVRHKVRAPETMLYFILVQPGRSGEGIGQLLMADLEEQTPHKRIALKVEKINERAIAFYEKLGYVIESEDAYKGKGLLMAKEIEK